MYKLTLLTLLGIFIMSIAAKSDDKEILPFRYEQQELKNGLKVVMISTPSRGMVAYYTIVRTGSRDEVEKGHSGFAHFFEHMMFRGTKKYPSEEYNNIITSLGADANAYTTDDYTCYHLNISSDDLEKVMELESDRFQNLSYDEDAFKTESQAVYGEYMKDKTNPFFLLWEELKDTAFREHTYKHTTMGFEKDVKAMPGMYKYSQEFFKKYYRPENTILLIVGDFEPAITFNMVQKYYGDWEKGYVPPQIRKEPPQHKPITASMEYPGKTLPIAAYAYKGEAFNPKSKDAISAMIIGDLAFGENSDLYKKLYIDEQVVQSLEPEFEMHRDPFLWIVWAQVKSDTIINYVTKMINTTFLNVKNIMIEDNKIDIIKKRLRYKFLMSLDTPDHIAANLARFLAITGDINQINDYYNTIDNISAADIHDAALKFVNDNQLTMVNIIGSK